MQMIPVVRTACFVKKANRVGGGCVGPQCEGETPILSDLQSEAGFTLLVVGWKMAKKDQGCSAQAGNGKATPELLWP